MYYAAFLIVSGVLVYLELICPWQVRGGATDAAWLCCLEPIGAKTRQIMRLRVRYDWTSF